MLAGHAPVRKAARLSVAAPREVGEAGEAVHVGLAVGVAVGVGVVAVVR